MLLIDKKSNCLISISMDSILAHPNYELNQVECITKMFIWFVTLKEYLKLINGRNGKSVLGHSQMRKSLLLDKQFQLAAQPNVIELRGPVVQVMKYNYMKCRGGKTVDDNVYVYILKYITLQKFEYTSQSLICWKSFTEDVGICSQQVLRISGNATKVLGNLFLDSKCKAQ